jgi:rod shape-determining protein MreD
MATGDGRSSGLRVTLTVILALLFSLVPLPEAIGPWRPNLLLLFVIYWSLSAPAIAGLMFAWLCGLATDQLTGMTLGQHALGFLVVAYATHKMQLRMRIFPIYHQTATVFMLLAVYEALMFWIDGITGHKVTTWLRWMPVVSGAIFWPIIVAILDTWNRRRR